MIHQAIWRRVFTASGVLRAPQPLLEGQRGRKLVPRPGRVPRYPGPPGEVAACGQGVRVLRAENPLTRVSDLLP